MSVSPSTTVHVARFRAWAAGQPNLVRLWLFGSHARGTEGLESDIDIAFEIDPLPDESNQILFRQETLPKWVSELQSISDYPVHLEPWAPDGLNVTEYVEACSISIYEREA